MRRCASLSPAEADAMFFPNVPGSKPTKAAAFCATCPVQRKCLIESIEQGLKGFWAGTTDDARAVMAKQFHRRLGSVQDVMPAEPKPRRVYRLVIIEPVVSTFDRLADLTNPLDSL